LDKSLILNNPNHISVITYKYLSVTKHVELFCLKIEYLFISNIDNLGATVDHDILDFFASSKYDFIMEVTDKTLADVKGGTLITYEDQIKLLEIAQVPSQYVDEFKTIAKFKIFNTNNIWIKLKSIKEKIHLFDLDIIENPKTLSNGRKIIQLETAIGSSIKYFNNPVSINVPRKRFLPVKATSDLFIIQSNIFDMQHGTLVLNTKKLPSVSFSKEFVKINDYMKRIPSPPDIRELEHLSLDGDITFGSGIKLKGHVKIVGPQHIESNSVIK